MVGAKRHWKLDKAYFYARAKRKAAKEIFDELEKHQTERRDAFEQQQKSGIRINQKEYEKLKARFLPALKSRVSSEPSDSSQERRPPAKRQAEQGSERATLDDARQNE